MDDVLIHPALVGGPACDNAASRGGPCGDEACEACVTITLAVDEANGDGADVTGWVRGQGGELPSRWRLTVEVLPDDNPGEPDEHNTEEWARPKAEGLWRAGLFCWTKVRMTVLDHAGQVAGQVEAWGQPQGSYPVKLVDGSVAVRNVDPLENGRLMVELVYDALGDAATAAVARFGVDGTVMVSVPPIPSHYLEVKEK